VHDHLLLGTTASSAGERKEYQCLPSTIYETFAIGLTLTTSMAVPGMSTMAVAGMSVTGMMPFMVSVVPMAVMVRGMSMARIGMAAFRSNQSKLTQAQGEGEGDANRNCYEK